MHSDRKQVALVSGGNKGIGRETVRGLAERGYIVYMGSRDAAGGERAKEELALPASDIRVVPLDVTDADTVAGAAELLREQVGRLDILVNNAGVQLERAAPTKCDPQTLRQTYEVNVFGTVSLTQAMMPLLRNGDAKVIVNVSSELGSLALHSEPDFRYGKANLFAYNSSKAALNALTVLLAKELKEEGFKVNSVDPGYTSTALNQFNGAGSAQQAAQIVVRYATLGADGPTGGFFTEGGTLPW